MPQTLVDRWMTEVQGLRMYQRSSFLVTVEDRGDRASIRAMGELDVAAEFRWNAAVAEARAHPSQLVEVDLSEVTFIDSCWLRLLLDAWTRADANEAEGLTVVKMSAPVHRLADLTGLREILSKSSGHA